MLGAAFIGSGLFPTSAQEPITQPVTAPSQGTVEYGEYVSKISGCHDCHGQTLSGEPGFDGSRAPNLRVEVKDYTQEQFVQFFSTGKLPEGRTVETTSMPWQDYRRAFTDEEFIDLYNYLISLPATGGGN